MRSMTEACRALLWALVACVFLTPRPSFAASEAEPTSVTRQWAANCAIRFCV